MIIVKPNRQHECLCITKNNTQSLVNSDNLISLTVTENGEYIPQKPNLFNKVTVDVVCDDYYRYNYFDGKVDEIGLYEIGWSDTDVEQYRDNVLHPSYTDDDYIVSETNKGFYGSVKINNVEMFQYAPEFAYSPKFDIGYYTSLVSLFEGFEQLKGVPNLNTSKVKYFDYMFMGCDKLVTIPQLDFSNAQSMYMTFTNCTNLQNVPDINAPYCQYMGSLFNNCRSLIYAPKIECDNVKFIGNMFNNCVILKYVPLFNTSKVTDMSGVFWGCTKLEKIPNFDTSNVTNMSALFHSCSSLKECPNLITSNVSNVNSMFYNCSKLVSIPLLDFGNVTSIYQFFGTNNNFTLTDLGGFKNLKIDWNDSYGLYSLHKLTKQSAINILNNLYDFVGNGEDITRTIKFSTDTKRLLSADDIAIATNKGWIIS